MFSGLILQKWVEDVVKYGCFKKHYAVLKWLQYRQKEKEIFMMKQVKKTVMWIMILTMFTVMLTGCGTDEKAETGITSDGETETQVTDSEGNIVTEVKERGLSLAISPEYLDKGLEIDPYNENTKGYLRLTVTYYSPTYEALFDELLDMEPEERTQEVSNRYTQELWEVSRGLMEIALVETDEYKRLTASGKKDEDFTYYAPAEWFGENEGYTYIISIPELDRGKLNEEEWQAYQECREYMQTVKENISFIPIELESYETNLGERMPDFSSEDLFGNQITNEIFTEAELTVVNVWGTFCGPCIEEMPELAAWSDEMPEGVQIVGIVGDIEGKEDTEHLELAKAIAEKAGVSFVNIIADDDLKELMKGVVGFPTTFFVDKDGNIVGEPVVGADVEAYKAFVEEYMNE